MAQVEPGITWKPGHQVGINSLGLGRVSGLLELHGKFELTVSLAGGAAFRGDLARRQAQQPCDQQHNPNPL